MASLNLRAVIRIKTMARAAIAPTESFSDQAGEEMASAYDRLRHEAKALHERAGWDPEDFDRELPPLSDPEVEPGAGTSAYDRVRNRSYNAISAGRRARVLLGQLAAWAEGHQEAFEVEARLKANAEARTAEERRRSPGFG